LIDIKKLEKILPKVERPARYIGGEKNSVVKEYKEGMTRFLFAFPDAYEIGMSHLGTAILYYETNEREDCIAERTYAPFPDMQAEMKAAGIPLYSLESYTPAAEFDFIGFNLSYEMCYTNILYMLELAGIPLRSKDRTEGPIIVAGGTCAFNPEPLRDFIDIFLIGDGEELNMELLDLYNEHKGENFSRQAFLEAAKNIEGCYVPMLAKPGERVRKRYVKDLDKAYFPSKFIVPLTAAVHDRATIEIMRGCTRGCRFCQAGFLYRPVRERKLKTLCEQADSIINATGFEEISLNSLSSGDYSAIQPLAFALIDGLESRHVSVSLPSLRVDSFDEEYAKKMQDVKKSGFTFAPEAGTQRLRDVINKNVTEEDVLKSARMAFESGATTVKLYFMIGLPTETDEDLDGIADLVSKVRSVFYSIPKEERRGSLKINVSASSFVPKPFTPFQWCAQNPEEELRRKQRYLKDKLSKLKGVNFSSHFSPLSLLEAVFARGDKRLNNVLESAFKKGAKFDSWHEHFSTEAWQEAFAEAGLDMHELAETSYDFDEELPWDVIDCLVDKRYLKKEYDTAMKETTTRDCRQGCTGCGFGGRCK